MEQQQDHKSEDTTTTAAAAAASSVSSSSSSTSRISLKDSNSSTAAVLIKSSNGQKRQSNDVECNHQPSYHGVRMRSWGRWVSEIRQPRKKSRIWLGTYPTAEMAARAHDVAELTIKGSKAAHINFPELIHRLPRPVSTSPKDIQVAAALAAASEFGDEQEEVLSSSTSHDDNCEETLFDLPDLFVGIDDVSCYHPSSTMWVSSLVENHLCSDGDDGFRLENPFLWEFN